MTQFIIRASLLLTMMVSASHVHADDPKPATIKVRDEPYWVGQRIPIFVELRAPGTFSGTASFSVPEIPQCVLIKVENAVVSSEQNGDVTWFVQTHEFALFSQQDGTVTIPAFDVRFGHHNGFTGPVTDKAAQIESTSVTIQRPPGTKTNQFLVTTSSFDVSETWDLQPGPAKQGAIFHRVISQSADQMTGMALSPPSQRVPEGIKIYVDRPIVSDNTERGEFKAKRTDKLTYVMQSPGVMTLPAVSYVWWNPETKQFGETVLPAVTFDVAAVVIDTKKPASPNDRRLIASVVAVVLVMLSLIFLLRHRIVDCASGVWQRWNSPEKIAVRKLLTACRRDDANAAELAWAQWQNVSDLLWQPVPELESAILELQQSLYGTGGQAAWKGRTLAESVRMQSRFEATSKPSHESALPELNPSR